MTIQSGCTQSTQYTQQETACLIANNEEYFSQFNIKTYALETKQKKQFSSKRNHVTILTTPNASKLTVANI